MIASILKRYNGLWHTFSKRRIKKLEGFTNVD
jgi:hypothetical protein